MGLQLESSHHRAHVLSLIRARLPRRPPPPATLVDRWLIRWYRSFAAKSVNRAVAALAQIPELLDPRALLEGRLPTLEDLAKRGAPITPYIVNAEEAAYVDPYV